MFQLTTINNKQMGKQEMDKIVLHFSDNNQSLPYLLDMLQHCMAYYDHKFTYSGTCQSQ